MVAADTENGQIGTSVKMLNRLRGQVSAQKGKVQTKEYFEKASAETAAGVPSLDGAPSAADEVAAVNSDTFARATVAGGLSGSGTDMGATEEL